VSTIGLLIDTNVVLDVVLNREPWAAEAARLFDAVERGKARGFIAGHAITTVYYVVEKERGRQPAILAVSDLMELFTVVSVGEPEFHRALTMGLADFEDAVQVAAYLAVSATYLVTRNKKNFKGAPASAFAPGEVLALLTSLPPGYR